MTDEQHVMDEIDELIATELDDDGVPLDDYNQDRYVKCELCHHDWHGSPNKFGCPGAWATDEQKQAYETGDYSKSVAGPTICVLPGGSGDRFAAIYTSALGHVVRGTVTFASGENAFVATFTPDREGLTAGLVLYDEANNFNPPIVPLSQRNWPGIIMGDTP